jgi:3-hydroxyisobutyrate dehydrogenase
MRVGFIGLGSQGGPMARAIVDAGHPLTLWARRAASLEPYADTAAKTAGTPAELGAASDLVCLCVVGDDDVEQVLTGPDGVLSGMAPGGIVAVHSTVHPDTCKRLAATAAERGVTLIDAPVSGGGMGAAAGTLLVMIGGEEDVVERVRPVFSSFANPIVRMGPLGSGQVTKILNNVLFTAHLAVGMSLLELGQGLGVDSAPLAAALTKGTGNSFAFASIAGSGGTLDRLTEHAGALLQKDCRLAASLAEAAGAEPGLVLANADDTLARMHHPR